MAENDFKCGMCMWHDHDIDFARWQHPAVLHVTLESWQWIHQVASPCNVTRCSGVTCHWIWPVAAPCNVTRSSRIMILNSSGGSTLAGGCGVTCHWIRPNVRHIGILLLVLISTILPHSSCHSVPICEILSKYGLPKAEKWRPVDFQHADLRHLGF